MKKYAVLLAFVILAFSVPLAQSSTTGTPQRLRALERQVRVLQAQVKTVKLRLACVSTAAASVTQYGVPSSNEGYLYQRPTATPSQFPTTALDFTLTGDKASALLPLVSPKCVRPSSTASQMSNAKTSSHALRVFLIRPAR